MTAPSRHFLRLAAFLAFSLGSATTVLSAPARIEILSRDLPAEGLEDPRPVAPVGGNPRTTLGGQRRFVLEHAAAAWGERLRSSVPIEFGVSFDPLPCSAGSAVLGSAGPETVARDFAGAPLPGTWYVVAAANALAGLDLAPDQVDMHGAFNSRLGQSGCGFAFYLGVDGNPPAGQLDFRETALHEMGHGLGFLAMFDPQTGAKLAGADDPYLLNLVDARSGRRLVDMTDDERAGACRVRNAIRWDGPNVVAESARLSAGADASGRVAIYTPEVFRPGSSVSHLDTALSPDELMEPFLTGRADDLSLSKAVFADTGWPTVDDMVGDACPASSTTLCLLGGRFSARLSWNDGTGVRDAYVAPPRTGGTSSSSGLFYFYPADPANWEILVKMIDGCATNGTFWTLVSASTGFAWRLTVTDHETGRVRTWDHPLDGQASGISDFAAFDGCR